MEYDGQSVFDLDVVDIDPERNGAGCYLIVDDPEAWHARTDRGGTRRFATRRSAMGGEEYTLRDPWQNNVRIGRGS